jgi:hypothetical protein
MTRELQLQRSLKFNGHPVRVVCGQVIDFLDIDFTISKKKKRPKCVCGAQALGYKPYMHGHAEYCDVHMNKTPVMVDNPYYEKEK